MRVTASRRSQPYIARAWLIAVDVRGHAARPALPVVLDRVHPRAHVQERARDLPRVDRLAVAPLEVAQQELDIDRQPVAGAVVDRVAEVLGPAQRARDQRRVRLARCCRSRRSGTRARASRRATTIRCSEPPEAATGPRPTRGSNTGTRGARRARSTTSSGVPGGSSAGGGMGASLRRSGRSAGVRSRRAGSARTRGGKSCRKRTGARSRNSSSRSAAAPATSCRTSSVQSRDAHSASARFDPPGRVLPVARARRSRARRCSRRRPARRRRPG